MEARFWRFRDVHGVLALDRFRLQVIAYEGGSGETQKEAWGAPSGSPRQ